MTYYELEKLRDRCLGSKSNTSQDPSLMDLGAYADSKIEDMIISTALKSNKVKALPVFPLPSNMVTQNLKDASTDLATSLYFQKKHQFQASQQYKQSAQEAIDAFVVRLQNNSTTNVATF